MICKIGNAIIDTSRGEVLVGAKRYLYTFTNNYGKEISLVEGERGNDPADFWYRKRTTWNIPCPWSLEEVKMDNKMDVIHWKRMSVITITFGDDKPYVIGLIIHDEHKFITFGNMPDVDI